MTARARRCCRPTATYSSTIGATDGVIMPTIITSHMANMNAKCAAVHGMKSGDIIPDMSKPVPSQYGVAERENGQRQQRDDDDQAIASQCELERRGAGQLMMPSWQRCSSANWPYESASS